MNKAINVIYNTYTNTIRDGITNRAILVRRGIEWSLDMIDISGREPEHAEFVSRLAIAYAFNHSVKWSNDGVRLAAFINHYANGGKFQLKPALINTTSDSIPLTCSIVEAQAVDVISPFDAGTHALLMDSLLDSDSVLLGGVRDKIAEDLDTGTLKYCFDIGLGTIGGFRVWVDNELIGYVDVKAI